MSKDQRSKKKELYGLVYVFTGEGKGKTTAALGVGVRAALSGMKVGMVAWYKSKDWDVAEYRLPNTLPNFQVFPMGAGFRIRNYESRIMNKTGKQIRLASLKGGGMATDVASEKEHREAAREALGKAKDLVGKVDLLILDEVNNAVKDKLINLINLIDLISKRGKTHLVLTGRDAHRKIIEMADLVTQMRKIKHPYDLGKKAMRGLDY